MSTNYTDYSQFSNTTITVSSTSELNAALANLTSGGGGTILLDGNGGPYDIQATGVGDANNPVLIQAADPNNEPLVQNIYLNNCSHITMTQLDVNSVGTGSTVHDLRISNSDHIEFVDNSMTSNADGFWDGTNNVTQGGQAALIRDSSDIMFSNNTVTDYDEGTTFLEVQGLTYTNNELTGMQGDGFRAGGIQNALIDNNYMHDFYGSLQTLNHTDFIQIWSTNTTLVTSDVEISNNVLDSNGGATSQGIFIGNELTRGGANGPMYQNISIHDNVVHTSSWHGITIEGTTGAQVYDNVVLFDDQAHGKTDANSSWTQAEPFMLISNATGAVVYGNIAGKVTVNGVMDQGTNNQILDYRDPSATTYTDNFMANLPAWSANGSTGTTDGTSTDNSGGTTTTGSTGGTDTSGTDTTGTDTSTNTDGDQTTTDQTEDSDDTKGPNPHSANAALQKSVSKLLAKFTNPKAVGRQESQEAEDDSTDPTLTVDDILASLTAPVEDELPAEETEQELVLELI